MKLYPNYVACPKCQWVGAYQLKDVYFCRESNSVTMIGGEEVWTSLPVKEIVA